MKITLKPISNILDSIYSHPEIYFENDYTSYKIDTTFTTEDEITYLILDFTNWYIKEVLYKHHAFDIQMNGILSGNGCDLFQTLKDHFVTKDNANEITSIFKHIENLDHDLYIEDIYIDRMDTSYIFVEIDSLSNIVSDTSNLTEDDIDLDNVIPADKIDKIVFNAYKNI